MRGQPEVASPVTAHVRLVDRKAHQSVGQGVATAALVGENRKPAVERALVLAAADVLPPVGKQLGKAGAFSGDDHPLAESGVVLVRLSAKTPFAMVLAEQRYLAGAKGVRAATLRRLSPAGWVIGVVTTDSIERVAQLAKKPPQADTSSTVKLTGDVVEVTLTGAAP